MATFQTGGVSLYDTVKKMGADENTLKTAELLQKASSFLQDAPVVMADSQQIYKFGTTDYVGLPWILKSELKNTTDQKQLRHAYMGHWLHGWAHSLEADFLHSTKANDMDNIDRIDGVDAYCSKLDVDRVIDGGASTVDHKKVMSIYLVAWDAENGAFVIAPQDNTAGIKFNILGDQVIVDPDNPDKHLVVEMYEMGVSLGFGLRDKRAVARIANIDCTTVSSSTLDTKWLIKAINQFPANLRSKIIIYVPSEIELAIQMTCLNSTDTPFVYDQNKLQYSFNGLPIRVSEAIIPQTTIIQ